MIDDTSLYPIEVSSRSESDHLSFAPRVWNVIYIGPDKFHHHFLHDIELLDEDGLEYMPHSASSLDLYPYCLNSIHRTFLVSYSSCPYLLYTWCYDPMYQIASY